MGRIRGLGWILLIAAALLLAGPVPATAEAPGEQVTGYFAETAFLRPAMEKSNISLDFIPAYTVVTMEMAEPPWALYTSPAGKTGYVHCGKLLQVPEYEKEAERYVYGKDRIEVRGLPNYRAATVYRTKEYELLTVNGNKSGFLHVVTEDGTEGYVMKNWVKKAEFRPKAMRPITLCVTEETPMLDMPLLGAHELETMTRDRFYRATGSFGNYYALETEEGIRYVAKDRTVICSYKGGDGRSFFSLPQYGRKGRKGLIETVLANGVIRKDRAQLRQTDGNVTELEAESLVYVYSVCGEWAGAACGRTAGYLAREDVEILTGESLMEQLRKLDLSGGSVERNPFLDQAFAMVEDGNPFQARYNLLTGADIHSLFPLGVPYFWGGRGYRTMTERLPRYTTREAWQSSRVYYQKGTIYLYGFDCIGFVKNVYKLAGKPIAGSVTGHRAAEFCDAGAHVYCDDVHPLPEDWAEAARNMQPGDIMIIHHPGTHAMMYMGTLRQFGYTAEQLPALAKYLDYPLMLQSGENPYSYLRFQSLISATEDVRIAGATPPDGGVGVCILGVDRADAEMVLEYHDSTSRCFDVEGSCVTIMRFDNVADYFVYRMGEGDADLAAAANSAAEDEAENAGDEDLP